MTSDTFKSKKYGSVFCGEAGHEHRAQLRKISDAGIYPGYIIRVGSTGFLYLTNSSDKIVSGVAAAMEGYDIDTVYTAGVAIEYYAVGFGMRVYVFLLAASPAPAVEPGDIIVASATDGMCMVFAYADATDITDDSEITKVGHADEVLTGHDTDNKLLAVVLN